MQHETLEFYRETAKEVGFTEIETIDVGYETHFTTIHWRANIKANQARLLEYFDQEKVDLFLSACDILDMLYKDNIATYGMMRAIRR
jgi:hypothetical protein